MRSAWLPEAGIPARVPIHICEHGWPTSEGRSEARQAAVLESAIRTIHAERSRLNIAAHSLFSLRDAMTKSPENRHDLFSFLGITTAAYERKMAFETYRRLIGELGS